MGVMKVAWSVVLMVDWKEPSMVVYLVASMAVWKGVTLVDQMVER